MAKPRLRIKEVAIQKGFDAAKLARRADMSYSTVWSLWNNPYRLNIPVKTLARLAEVLGVEIGQLIGSDSDTQQTETETEKKADSTDKQEQVSSFS